MQRFSKIKLSCSVASFAMLAMLTAGCTGTSHDSKFALSPAIGKDTTNVSLGITIVDEDGVPVKGAQVLIGDQNNSPFSGNFLQADNNGQLAIPAAWSAVLPVTIDAPGFVRATFFDRTPEVASFRLRHSPFAQRHELTGETTGFGDIQDGVVEIGFVLPSYTREELATFEPNSILNSETDTFKVMGHEVKIPSNIAIPTQSQTVVFPTTFSKPAYRYEFSREQQIQVTALHVSVPMDDLSTAIQNNVPIFNLLNSLTFIGGGKSIAAIQGAAIKLDIPINQSSFTQDTSVQAPKFATEDEMIVVAATETNGLYALSDAKLLQPGQNIKLSTDGGKGAVISILRVAQKEAIGPQNATNSIVISPIVRAGSTPEFLNIVAAPTVATSQLTLTPPPQTHSVAPLLTYGVLSKVELTQNGHYKLEKKTPQWELYAKNWVSDIHLPIWPVAAIKTIAQNGDDQDDQGESSDSDQQDEKSGPLGSSMRWEVSFAGAAGSASPVGAVGPEALLQATHVTRSATDF